jgi:mannose-6-phosphate isomerase-like protein (cupin superfamily)
MLVSRFDDCEEITANDGVILRELLSPLPTPALEIRYSLAHAILEPGLSSVPHVMKTSEVYFVIEGSGVVTIEGEEVELFPGDSLYIPPGATQHVTCTSDEDLVFLAIVDPAWRAEDEVIL